MRVLFLCVALVALPVGLFAQGSPLDAETAVRQSLTHFSSGLITPVDIKNLRRFGDESAVGLTKITAGKVLSRSDVDPTLLLIRYSFSDLSFVEAPSDREPRTTLFVLRYLELCTNDAKQRGEIANARDYVEDQYRKSTKRDVQPTPESP
jgi:hypothetical protein